MTALARPIAAVPAALMALLEALPEAALIAADDGRIVAVNGLAATLFGYRAEELLGQPVEALLPADAAARHVALRHAYGRAPERRGARPLRACRRDGDEFAAEIGLGPFTWEGRPLVIATVRDLTVHEALRQDLRARDAAFVAADARRALLESAVSALPFPVAIGTADDLRFEYVNQALATQFGYATPEEVIGQMISLVADDPAQLRADAAAVLAHGATIVGTRTHRRRDGTILSMLVAANRLPPSPDGRPRVVASFIDQSDRERAAAALHAREEQLRAILDAFPVAAALISPAADGASRALYTNRGFVELFGFDSSTLPDWSAWYALRYPAPEVRATVRARTRAAVAEARRTGAPTAPIESLMTVAGGAQRTVELVVAPVGEQLLAVFRDVTEHRRAEARFRSILDGIAPTTGAAFFASLTHHLRVGLGLDWAYVAERDGDVVRALAMDGPNGIEPPFSYAASDSPCGAGCPGCCWTAGVSARFPERSMLADRAVEALVCEPLVSSIGEPLGVLAVMHGQPLSDPEPVVDMLRIFAGRAAAEIERDRADRALHALTQELERRVAARTAEVRWQAAAMDVATEGMTIVTDSRLRYANPAFARMLGYATADEVVGQCWTDFHDPDEVVVAARAIGPALLAEGRWRGTLALRRRDGSHIAVDVGLAAGEGGDVISAYRDITERLRLEEELRRGRDELSAANAQLLRASRTKDEFLATMSHELRTPLNAVLGISEAMAEEVYGPLSEAQRAALANVGASGRHLLDLINDVLDLSKIESGHMTLDVDAVDVRAACQATAQVVRERATRKQIELAVDVPADLRSIPADRRRLKQILLNLLDNALKFTAPGGRVVLAAARDAQRDAATFTVRDTGIGIAADALPLIFSPFTQVDRGLDREYPGTGLGLSLVQRLADLHGGSVEVTSAPGQGSTFVVSLPLHSPLATDLDLEPRAAAIPQAEAAPRAARGERILLADDNAANATFLRDYLEALGYRVVLAHDGREAVERAGAEHPALILMDIQMPVLDGLSAIRELRADPALRPVPIIACTALAMPGDRERCLAAGADEYLAKPIRLKELRAVVGRHLARAAGERT